MREKRWIFLNQDEDSEKVLSLSDRFSISRLAAITLINRGIGEEEAERFFSLSPALLHSPFLMEDMGKAVDRIRLAAERGERVVIFGDYDVDGITATVILTHCLKGLGIDIDSYIPDRESEGYGLNKDAIKQIKDFGATLLITVDCGITAAEEIEYAAELGLDVIITDHHSCKEPIPRAAAILNPKLPGSEYPFKELAGVGVAYKLASALTSHEGALSNYSDLVALGTVADVVSLTGENRILTVCGLSEIARSPRVGLKALMDIVELDPKDIDSGKIAFALAPRLNAAGRMSSAGKAVKLLLTEDERVAAEIANALNLENKDRQVKEAKIYEEVNDRLKGGAYDGKKVFVLSGEGWHSGVIGIVASHIKEQYYKSTILIAISDGVGKGSGRSVQGLNMFEALGGCAHILEQYGGHALAAGLTVKEENIETLERLINDYAENVMGEDDLTPPIYIDAEIKAEEITVPASAALSALSPFGAGNREPVFALTNAKISRMFRLSGGRHVRILLEKDGRRINAVGFNMGVLYDKLKEGDIVDVAAYLAVNTYKGVAAAQLRIKDVRRVVPMRADFARLYNHLKAAGSYTGRLSTLGLQLNMGRTLLKNTAAVFCELGLITIEGEGKKTHISLVEPPEGQKKINLHDSEKYKAMRGG